MIIPGQFGFNCPSGFRENHRTADSIFVLKSLINKYIHKNKKKIYACFVDLRKAFDSVPPSPPFKLNGQSLNESPCLTPLRC
jgi:hypothetical protein